MKKYPRMLFRAMIICSSLYVLGGCAPNYDYIPEITQSRNSAPRTVQQVRPKVIKPKPIPKQETTQIDFPREWLPPADVEKQWMAIVIHHSATENGNAAIFDRMHREHNHWDGVGYDFVIGNGTNSGNGEVEVTFRWQRQIAGAHCGGTPDNWANVDGIGICLVGNFENTTPTTQQMESLLKLVRFLKKRYRISNGSIYGHKNTPGAHITDCPGSNFPMAKLKWLVSS